MASRLILGPQDQYERNGTRTFRDIRPLTIRLSETLRGSASGLILGMLAAATWFEPAIIDLTVPASMLYATWVLTRAPTLPMRLPRSADRPDHGNLAPGTRKPKPANGTIFIGWDISGNELWITAEDARQHITIPGTTGAGKTTAILSLLSNAVMQGSGFVLVDGKGDRDLYGKALALARSFGRDDDIRVLSFMVASGIKDSHTFNPFSIGNADALRELLASQLGEPSSQRLQRRLSRARRRADRHARAGADLAARHQGRRADDRGHPLLDRAAVDLEARDGERSPCSAIRRPASSASST